ncbi:hypothetical protein LJR090_002564 [Bosea sp. LjRoot90]|uniref:hypothetical protein n=1 Tax=Bosea sp. LjRoot90 TaxID=3342342 RepID=UPI003ED01815
MPAGLRIINDTGTVQIDENWKNYGFRQKISVFLSTPGLSFYSLPVTGEAVLLAVKASTLMIEPLGSSLSGSTWTFDFRYHGEFTGGGSETVDFYVFDVPPAGGFSNVGMQVFNASGERVYHSDMDVMKVPPGGILPCNTSFFGTPGRTYAPLTLINPTRTENVGGYFTSTRALRVSGSDILSSNILIGPGGFLDFANEGLYAAVDVTGLS